MTTDPQPCPAAIIAWLNARGIKVRLHGRGIQAGPTAKLTGDVRTLLAECGGSIADYLRSGKPIFSVVADEPGGAERWEDTRGDEHCTTCDPPTKARAILETAGRIRRRLNVPTNPRAERLLRIVRAECSASEAVAAPQTSAEHPA